MIIIIGNTISRYDFVNKQNILFLFICFNGGLFFLANPTTISFWG